MSKQLTIQWKGQPQVLEVGKFYFQKFLGETMGKDPLSSETNKWSLTDQFNFVVAVVFAGLSTQYKVDRKPVDFTIEDVRDWVGLKEESEIADLIIEYTKINQAGEGERQLNGAEKESLGGN